jgi:DNA replication and repair protein RecF
MTIDHLHLFNFKNYAEADITFSKHLNILVGNNGSGKTNLLDAIYSLAFTKGSISSADQHYIKEGENQMVVRGTFTKEGKKHDLTLGLQVGQKKVFREDGQDYGKLSEHIGKYPAVLVLPDDVDLVKDGSESRRRFFDTLISQFDKAYLDSLMRYNHCLKQRNGLLKMFAESGRQDWAMIESYDSLLVPLGQQLFQKRLGFMEEFLGVFQHYYQLLVANEPVNLRYSSQLIEEDYKEGLFKCRPKDLALQRTSFGIHRDDFVFLLGEGDLKKLGSQGQQKSFVLSMKLAQLEILKQHKGFYPVLLLDDVFDKLDSQRIAQLLKLFPTFGQVFLTDARPDRTLHLLDNVSLEKSIFTVEKGQISGYTQEKG